MAAPRKLAGEDPLQWQRILETEFAPQVDASLIAALVHEPGQTLEGARSVLAQLAGHEADVAEYRDEAARQEEAASEEEHLARGDTEDESESSHTPDSSVKTTSISTDEVERALAEWKLIDAEQHDPATLRMTDEEGEEIQMAQETSLDKRKRKARSHIEVIAQNQAQESKRLGELAANGKLPIEDVAAGEEDIAPRAPGSEASSIDFLSHAFPSRTRQFLQDMLDSEHGDVQQAIDTLMALELAESGALDADDEAEGSASRHAKSMLDDDAKLLAGTGHKKRTKRDRQRQRVQEMQASALDGKAAQSSQRMNKINLTDVRHGGGHQRLQRYDSNSRSQKDKLAPMAQSEQEDDAALAQRLAREERVAAGLPAEEGPMDDAVRDNDWLFSSSVLEQLGVLLELPSHVVRSVHAQSHMNLRATTQRLIHQQAQLRPSLEEMDVINAQPEGTLAQTAQGLTALLPSKPRSDVERVLRATNGRQDCALDLLQLRDRVEDAAAGEKTDILDPMKMDRGPSANADVAGTTVFAPGGGLGHALIDSGYRNASPTPYASAVTHKNRPVGYSAAAGFSSSSRSLALQRLREGTPSVTFPLHSGQAEGPLSGDTSAGPANAETASQAARMAREYAAIAEEYQTRRKDYLLKAAQAYRSTAQGVAGGGGTRGHIRGAAAFAYADEARRLDAKARAFRLQAAQATVRHRTLLARGGSMATMAMSSSSGRSAAIASARDADTRGQAGDIVDLHGVTVHEALSITRQALQEWWPKARRGPAARDPRTTPPLHIITGVGRHSRGQVAVIRPAVLAMLEREHWRLREPQQGHIVVLGQH